MPLVGKDVCRVYPAPGVYNLTCNPIENDQSRFPVLDVLRRYGGSCLPITRLEIFVARAIYGTLLQHFCETVSVFRLCGAALGATSH
jgi:hypothetical protein